MKNTFIFLYLVILIFFSINICSATTIKKGKNYTIEKDYNGNETLFINGKKQMSADSLYLEAISDDGSKFFYSYLNHNNKEVEKGKILSGKEVPYNCELGSLELETLICYTKTGFSYDGKEYKVKLFESRYYEPKPYVDEDGNIWYYAAVLANNTGVDRKAGQNYFQPTDVIIYKNNEALYTIHLEIDQSLKDIHVIENSDGYDYMYYSYSGRNDWFRLYKNGEIVGKEFDKIFEYYHSKNYPNVYFYKGFVEGEGTYFVINGEKVSDAYSTIQNVFINEDLSIYGFEGLKEDGTSEFVSHGIELDDYHISDFDKFELHGRNDNFFELYSYYERYIFPSIYDITELDKYGYIYKARQFIKNNEVVFEADKEIIEVFQLQDLDGKVEYVYTHLNSVGYIELYNHSNKKIGIILKKSSSKFNYKFKYNYFLFNDTGVYKLIFPNMKIYKHYGIVKSINTITQLKKFKWSEFNKLYDLMYIKKEKYPFLVKHAQKFKDIIPRLSNESFYNFLARVTFYSNIIDSKIEKLDNNYHNLNIYSKDEFSALNKKYKEVKKVVDFLLVVLGKDLEKRLK